MTPHLLDARTDVALRRLDPAPPTLPSDPSQAQATALLDRIVATDRGADLAAPDLGVSGQMDGTRLALLLPAARSRSVRRVAAAGLAAAILAVGAIVLPARSPDYAYADWTVTPTHVTTRDASRAAAACRESVSSAGDGRGTSFPASKLTIRLAERRGAWVLTFLSATLETTTADTASCIVHLPRGTDGPPVVVDWAGGGGGGSSAPTGAELTPGGTAQFGPTDGLEALIRGSPGTRRPSRPQPATSDPTSSASQSMPQDAPSRHPSRTAPTPRGGPGRPSTPRPPVPQAAKVAPSRPSYTTSHCATARSTATSSPPTADHPTATRRPSELP